MSFVVEADWMPENPLGIELFVLTGFFPEPDWSMGGLIEDGPLSMSDSVKVGLYGWIIYGALITAEFGYFADEFYYAYTMSDQYMHLAFRTWYGTINWIKNATKVFGWGIAGFFWAVSLIPIAQTFQYFAVVTTYLLMIETFTTFLQVTMGFISLFA